MAITYSVCNKCGYNIAMTPQNFGIIKKGYYEVSYLRCPGCGKKYQILTSNPELRKLIKRHLDLNRRMKRCITHPLPLRKALKSQFWLTQLLYKQKKLIFELKKRGDEIMNGENK